MNLVSKQTISALTFLVFAAFAVPCVAVCQKKSSTDEVVRINTDLVVIDAQVMNRKTRQPVGNLKQNDFELYEDGVKQEITHFSQDKLPLSIVLLLDMSGSVKPIIEQISNGALDALRRLKPEDETALMAFGTTIELVQDFTRDRELMSGKIANVGQTANVGDATLLNEAVYEATRQAAHASNPASRRVIIVVTDNIAAPAKGDAGRKAFTELFETGTVVSGLIVRGAFGKVVNVLSLGQVRALNPYSERTGGEIINADKREVETKLAELIDHLRTRYSFGYRPANTQRSDVFRRLELRLTPAAVQSVGVSKDKLSVRFKEGYYREKRRAGQS